MIWDCQNDELYKKHSVKFILKSQNEIVNFYIPYIFAIKISKSISDNLEIYVDITDSESFNGFYEFIKDFLIQDNKLYIRTKLDIEKYIVSQKFTPNFYEFMEKNKLYNTHISSGDWLEQRFKELNETIKISIKVILECSNQYIEEILIKYTSLLSNDCLYILQNHFRNLPKIIFKGRTAEIDTERYYDTHTLSLFDNIKYRYDVNERRYEELSYTHQSRIYNYTIGYNYITTSITINDSNQYDLTPAIIEFKPNEYNIRSTITEKNFVVNLIIGNSIIFLKNEVIESTKIYDKIMTLQNNKIFIEDDNNIFTRIIDNNYNKHELYLPKYYLENLDNDYYKVMMSDTFKQDYIQINVNNDVISKKVFSIMLSDNETIDGFLEYLKDYIDAYRPDKPYSVTIKSLINENDLIKLSISERMNKIYKMEKVDFNRFEEDIKNIAEINEEKDNIYLDIIKKYIEKADYNDIYNAILKYPNLKYLFDLKQFSLTIGKRYDIQTISYFKKIYYELDYRIYYIHVNKNQLVFCNNNDIPSDSDVYFDYTDDQKSLSINCIHQVEIV